MLVSELSRITWSIPPLSLAHYGDVIMGAIESQITSLTIVSSTVYSDADQRKHQSSASLAIVWGIQRGPVNSSQKWPVTRKMFPFDDVIIYNMGIQKNQIGSLYFLRWISTYHAISVPGNDFVHFMYWLKLDWKSHFVCCCEIGNRNTMQWIGIYSARQD